MTRRRNHTSPLVPTLVVLEHAFDGVMVVVVVVVLVMSNRDHRQLLGGSRAALV